MGRFLTKYSRSHLIDTCSVCSKEEMFTIIAGFI
uniref:Uncharacterized protein n=1 Tax=Romanomermis culicivorax TaxID=13658 RepID=A0A915IU57_ROMCU